MRTLQILVGTAILAGLLFPDATGPGAAAQDPSPERRDEQEELHFGAGSCAAQACHGGGFEERMEYKTWATKDPHSHAYETLTSKRGQEMGKRLGIDSAKSERCLSCHGTTGVKLADTFDQADGVSCELCHGGARDWLGPHVDAKWRERPASWKETKHGLRDLSTPAKRVETCVQCHVGTKARPMSHDIMAAGHPPLTFDGGKFVRDLHPHWKDDEDWTVQSWVEGLRHASIAELDRIAHAARNRRAWPEFSVFDCYSCHHEIGANSVYKSAPNPGDLRFDLAPLHVLVQIAGIDPGAPILTSIASAADPRTTAKAAETLSARLRALTINPVEVERCRARLHGALSNARKVPLPPHMLQQLSYAVDVLAPDRSSKEYRSALGALMKSPSAERALTALSAAGYSTR